MALEACVMKVRPLKLVFCRNQGRAPQWSRWKLKRLNKFSWFSENHKKNNSSQRFWSSGLTGWWAAGQFQPDRSDRCRAEHPSPPDPDGSHSPAEDPNTQTEVFIHWGPHCVTTTQTQSYHDLSPFELQDDAGSSHFLSGSSAHKHKLSRFYSKTQVKIRNI